jgi:protein TonB
MSQGAPPSPSRRRRATGRLAWALALSLSLHGLLLAHAPALAPRALADRALSVRITGLGVVARPRVAARARQLARPALARSRSLPAAQPLLPASRLKASPHADAQPGPVPAAAAVTETAAVIRDTASSLSAPRFLDAGEKPPYPRVARDLGEQGRVELKVAVSAEGKALQVVLLQGSGHDLLDQAALEWVRRGAFSPARRDGQAIASWLRLSVPFRLGTPCAAGETCSSGSKLTE